MSNINVKVDNRTNLEELKLQKNIDVELPKNAKVKDLLGKLDLERLKEENGSVSTLVMMFKNKKPIQNVEEKIEDGDKIKLVPMASGG